jgi:hypothetical protein
LSVALQFPCLDPQITLWVEFPTLIKVIVFSSIIHSSPQQEISMLWHRCWFLLHACITLI